WVDLAATGEAVSSLGSASLAGTSYAAPVVSGLAALIRARFPTMTARQVMQRIESTAHHPPAGWNPVVGNGTIDALAAVSTDSIPPISTSNPGLGRVPPPPPAPPARADRQGRKTALGGAAICWVALGAPLAPGAARGRLRGPRHSVPSD